ncbi:MAG: hypothetical protein JWO19_4409 [Bryobacterales bacterium]|nr:hypothetical protein [Bryobacterales bacterium]
MADDKPYRISFPRPIVLHGSGRKNLIERVLEYLRQPDKLVIEPLGPDLK